MEIETFKLIQPDLLTVDELISVLKERGVAPSLLNQSKDNLVSLFKRVALPLPQRELRQNYRGSLLLNLRKKIENVKVNASTAQISDSYTIGIRPSKGIEILNRPDEKEMCIAERLKPPPSAVNFERKTIRLNKTTKHSASSELEKIVIKKQRTSESNESNVTINGNKAESTKVISKTTGNTSKPRKVSLKRNFTSKPTSETTQQTEEKPDPDKKRKPIAWP